MIRTIAVAINLLVAASNLVAEELRKPNFVAITIDDMGYAGVSCFDNPYFKTPEIDRLATAGRASIRREPLACRAVVA